MEKIKIVKKFTSWLKDNWVIVVILSISAILRLYMIGDYMTFLGDEGRDMIIVRRLLKYADPILIGPGTSVGSMYLGPLYYYLIAPSLLLANYSPIGPSIFVAVIGVATTYLVFKVSSVWFSAKKEKISIAGMVAAGLYAISPTVIIFSRSSWNPNVMPFFSLLVIFSLWKMWHEKEYKYIIVASISYAFCLQSHYLGLLLAPTIIFYWIIAYLRSLNLKDMQGFIKNSVIGFSLFLFLMSPLLIFDLRHNFINTNAVKAMLTKDQTALSVNPMDALLKIPKIASDISVSLLGGRNKLLGEIILAIVSIPSLLLLLGRKKLHPYEASGYSMLFVWIMFSLLGFGFYRLQIYDHYFGFLFTAPFILLGGFIESAFDNLGKLGKSLLFLILGVIVYFNIIKNPFFDTANRQMPRSMNVARVIEENSGGKPFNLAVLAERNYEDGYQYFLEKDNYPVVEIDAQITKSVTDQLFVVCELPKEKCDPTHSPKAEVANFGWSKIDGVWEESGVIIYKLIHTQ